MTFVRHYSATEFLTNVSKLFKILSAVACNIFIKDCFFAAQITAVQECDATMHNACTIVCYQNLTII